MNERKLQRCTNLYHYLPLNQKKANKLKELTQTQHRASTPNVLDLLLRAIGFCLS